MTSPLITYAEAAKAVAHLRLAGYRFTLQATTPIHLPPYKGSTFRGGFGHALKRTVCVTRQPVCDSCILRSQCLYPFVFETTQETGASNPGIETDITRPFVLIPPLETRQQYRPGDVLSCDLVLIGKTADYLPYFIYTMEELGRLGVGRGKGHYAVTQVHAVRCSLPEVEIYTGRGSTLHNPGPPISGMEIVAPWQGHNPHRMTLSFLTPMRLKHQGHLLAKAPEFHVVQRRLLDRLTALSQYHHDLPFALDTPAWKARAESVRLVDSHVSQFDWERYSHRQQTRMKLGGVVGTVTYEGDLAPFLPLLALGEWVHVGKGATFGLGKYRIVDRDRR